MKEKIKTYPAKTLRVIGIDPGTATTGWAVVEKRQDRLFPLGFGFIQTAKEKTESERLLEISLDLEKIIDKFQPQESATERIFLFKNQKTVIQIGQARGAILLTLEKKNVKLWSYTPLQIKQAVTGYGRAEKKQVQFMVKKILNLKSTPKPDDVADALAIAICHLNNR
ncbi:MAG: crossover junction endodeoxyribonuclease RuvC [Candidatus Moranbacteria bacterium CG06_land_8_20_14_3_00_40_12]|nr:MAG: crossover junction endodeoxyribonuclease RuvC [Candidatus Moranbacteria bacterium CG23_combo_of_CG06-09_8_20_14_all_40_16]PIU80974.1 MAG: crossover junction endodeoxyribonuclease RuvC [Candidatus Moranbacteria bacterium CG06_land_8_20_14_3_00_40_12]